MSVDDPDVARLLPLRPRDYLILFALISSARHGYGIMRQVAEETDGTTKLDPANLYRAIKRLSRQGLVQEAMDAADEDEPSTGERRRFSRVR